MTDKSTGLKQWLDKLQQESWQLELLISGLALFGIYAARTTIQDLTHTLVNEVASEYRIIGGIIIFIIQKGWLIFFINLIIHLILRGLWIGTIGLRYVSQEIDYDSFGYAPRFTNFLKKKVGSYDDYIESLERMCSIIFAYTFLLFLLFTSMMAFFVQTFIVVDFFVRLGQYSSNWKTLSEFFGILYFLLGIILFIDLITLGGIKRIKERTISGIYFYIYRYFSITTLSFLYRPILYNFIDNKYTRRLFYFSIPYILIILLGWTLFENNPNPFNPTKVQLERFGLGINPYLYDDLRDKILNEYPNEERKLRKGNLGWVTLENFYIEKPISSFFVKTDENFVELLFQDGVITPYKKKGFSFSWFNKANIKDSIILTLENSRSSEMSQLYEDRRMINRELRTKDLEQNRNKRDSLTSKIEERESHWQKVMEKAEKEKISNILEAYLSYIKMSIDTLDIQPGPCFFTIHPHNEEKGIRCFFSIDNIDPGHHSIKFSRLIFDIDNNVRENTIFLPFLKQ